MSTNTTNLPTDPLFNKQWYLLNTGQTKGIPGKDLNVVDVWADYDGTGVLVGIIDDSVQYVHPDLAPNYNTDLDIDVDELDNDPAPGNPDDEHGTSVAGIIAAKANNGIGGVGVAPGATIAGIRMAFGPGFGPTDQDIDALLEIRRFDVVNNSWGYNFSFYDNFTDLAFQQHRIALQDAVQLGREGLGSVIVFAAGNSRELNDSSNYHNLSNSRFTISVAALTHKGKYTYYSSPGADILVSAFGGDTSKDGIVTTDRLGLPGYNLSPNVSDASDYTDQFGGTSAATPMVSGVVALMLQANPDLGYRDVQEILAYTARKTDGQDSNWLINGATNWNGGGLHSNINYGFGMVDARAAVRLAEVWTEQSTYANEKVVRKTAPAFFEEIPDGTGSLKQTLDIASGLNISRVELDIDLSHLSLSDLTITLKSPNGTRSVLMQEGAGISAASQLSELRFTFSSAQFWGETGVGTWTLKIRDRTTGNIGTLNSWSMRIYGDAITTDNVYIYTDEYSKLKGQPARRLIKDLEGTDVLNAAAVTTATILDLTPGARSTLAGRKLKVAKNTLIEAAFTGDGDDQITGNDADNTLYSGRGDDRINGGSGNDQLTGGKGNDILNGGEGNDDLNGGASDDTLTGGAGSDRFLFGLNAPFNSSIGIDTITDFVADADAIVLEKATFADLSSQAGTGFSKADEFVTVATNNDVETSSGLIVYSLATGDLFYNPNGSTSGLGSGAKFATLSGAPALSVANFIIQV